ncbi:MAG: FtsX-like permease family protein, partial [Longimicrobiales bacterium]
TVVHLQNVDTGFDPAGVMTAHLDLNWTTYDGPEVRRQFFHDLERELLALPGVRAVGVGSTFPLNDDPAFSVDVTIEDQMVTGTEGPDVGAMTASAGYFEALGVPLLRGRTFNSGDEPQDAESVGIVTRSFAERYWPGADPIGRRVSFDGGQNWGRIVGVVGDIRLGLEDDFQDLVFVPHYQGAGISARVLVRGDASPLALERGLRSAVAAVDRQQPVTDVLPLDAHRGERLSPYRLTALLMGMFALIALGVTAVGLAGVIAFSIAQRTREIGIRVAIGAQPLAVLRMVLGQTLALVIVGAGLGSITAFALADSLRDLVVGVPVADPLTFGGVALLLIAVATLAGLVPARRAVRIDPLEALQGR